MASDLQSTLEALLENDYTAVTIATIVVYDYILTFSREVEYIWSKPWTSVSTLFVLVRYLGICTFLSLSFVGSSFLPGPVKTYSFEKLQVPFYGTFFIPVQLWVSQGLGIQSLGTWTVLLFILAADLVMILRVWAIYHRSKLILGILLCSYTVEVIPSTIANIIYSNPKTTPMSVTHVLNHSFCSLGFIPLGWNKASSITQLIHSAVMCALVLIRFFWQSFQMYRATKQWRLNQFINLFAMEGVMYFFFMMSWNIVNTLYAWGNFAPVGWQVVFVGFVEIIPIATMAPRLVLNVRELYARNVRRTPRSGIDTGFGLCSSSTRITSVPAMVFADSGPSEGPEDDEEIQMGDKAA